jgi:hypothetical protein
VSQTKKKERKGMKIFIGLGGKFRIGFCLRKLGLLINSYFIIM